MKTEAQVKDIIRHLNGLIIENNTEAIDNMYRGKEAQSIEIIARIRSLRYGIELLNYILDDTCLLGEDY